LLKSSERDILTCDVRFEDGIMNRMHAVRIENEILEKLFGSEQGIGDGEMEHRLVVFMVYW